MKRVIITRSMKTSGDMATGGLGSIPRERTAKFKLDPKSRHRHEWIKGDLNYVCTKCGALKPVEAGE